MTYFFRRILGAFLLGSAAVSFGLTTGLAADSDERIFAYQIRHPVFGEIGTYTTTAPSSVRPTNPWSMAIVNAD